MRTGFVIAIDGPVASGKGTIASRLAKELNGFDLYTGAMYRTLALYALRKAIDIHNAHQITALLPEVVTGYDNGKILLNGEDVTDKIKEKDTAQGASIVAIIPEVREYFVAKQREIAEKEKQHGKIVILEGRDTATIVYPDAALKVYLTAADEVRAQRRLEQHRKHGEDTDFERILEEIRTRDKRDKGRDADPLPHNPEEHGYFVLDNSEMSENETIHVIKEELKRRKLLDD